ncbi:MAG: alpha/beta hydrolase [Thermoflexus sp.]|uniref:alpha/beta fold hydrolase n=1 Tax=Thermoflexus sp. TaxID=1969742 RepID=UPI0025ED4B7D|nr:alpha/beta fold hydrolase [Thermoflexus sp.]MCS6965127.1 alpha/beta hydrolase [Thermoflexus sp.]MDW8184653.1 alpha/beta fold hydrolase [Anaerolineae bacterium]
MRGPGDTRKIPLRDGLVLAVTQAGDPERPPLLLLHNACSTFRATWGRALGPLATRFHVIGPDLRGHGGSTNPEGRLDLREMADDLATLMDRIGVPDAHVMAFSGGASTALYLATRHPRRVRSMVLIGSHYTVRNLRTRGDAFWDPERIRREEPAWWAAMVRWHGSEERVEALLRGWREEDHHRPDFTPEDLQAIAVPTLLLIGENDPITPVEQTVEMARWLPRARLVVFPGAGHDVLRERPEEFFKAVRSFWEEIGIP